MPSQSTTHIRKRTLHYSSLLDSCAFYSVFSDWRFSTVCTGAVSEVQVHEHTQLTGVEPGSWGNRQAGGPYFRHRQEARGLLRQQLLPGFPEGKKVLQNLPFQSIFHQLSQMGGVLSLRFKRRSTSGFSSFNYCGRGPSHWS